MSSLPLAAALAAPAAVSGPGAIRTSSPVNWGRVNIAAGFRISASIALGVTITAELIAGNGGIGFHISQIEQANRLPPIYAGILLTGIFGLLLNTLYLALERRIVLRTPVARGRST